MTTPIWTGGTIYLPGDLVQRASTPTPVDTTLTNPGFESGSSDWTLGAGFDISGAKVFTGTQAARLSGIVTSRVTHDSVAVIPGTSITASCMYAQGDAGNGQNTGRIQLVWYTSGLVEISTSDGNLITSSLNGSSGWKNTTVTGSAPATAAFVSVAGISYKTRTDATYFDSFSWSYAPVIVNSELIFQATQAAAGSSGSSEPIWPVVLSGTVVDNEVTWTAVNTSRIEWTAQPILESGATEPTWPTIAGELVSDNSIAWEAIVGNVSDAKCPNSRVVAILASKIFAVDEDIVAFSATVNPLDWSTPDDAGYLPTGLQQYGANYMSVLGPYRGNLASFNSQGLQIWQVDEDPARMALIDAFPLGSNYSQALSPVNNDLFFLTRLGVRSVGIAAGSTNLQAGDVGQPIDVLIQAKLALVESGDMKAFSTYFPSQGQYWLAFTPQTPNYITWDQDNSFSMDFSVDFLTAETDDFANETNYTFGTVGQSSGLHYYELTIGTIDETTMAFGLGLVDSIPGNGDLCGPSGVALASDGQLWENGYATAGTVTFGVGDVCVCAFNATTGNVWLGVVNGASVDWEGGGDPATATLPTSTGLLEGTYFPFFSVIDNGESDLVSATANFGATAFISTAPANYVGWPNYQYTLYDETEIFVATLNQPGQLGAWSRYVYPFAIGYFTQLGNDLYARAGNTVYRLDVDSVYDNEVDGSGTSFDGILQWGWLDFGAPGVTKKLIGFDISGTGQAEVEFGYNQSDTGHFTTPWTVSMDTIPGGIKPMPLAAPTISTKLTIQGGEQWEWLSMNLYLQDFRVTS